MKRRTTTCCKCQVSRAPAVGARELARDLFAIVALVAMSIGIARGAPFTPASDESVLETLPIGSKVRLAVDAAAPMDWESALQQAREYVRSARQSGDSRYLGYARAVLKPWAQSASPSAAVLLLQAEIEQHEHQFEAALRLLDRVASEQPRLAATHQMRAAIYQVQGHYFQAQRECRYLVLQTSALTAIDCVARAMSRSGDASRAYQILSRLQATQSSADPIELRDSHLTLADIAVQLGRTSQAREHYDEAMKLAEPDAYTLATFADFLLEQGEFATVIQLAQRYAENQDLRIRAALAAEAGHVSANPWASEVRDQIASYRLRGDFKVTRDYARFLLDVEHDDLAALQAALENWRTQREPQDALIVMRAALKISPRSAAEVVAFVVANHLDDARLKPVQQALRRQGASS